MRDPRVDPMPGDIIRNGDKYTASFREVLEHDPRFASDDVSSFSDGVELTCSLHQWREQFATATVIRKAEDAE
jgi:hypothetical protein